MRVWAFEFSWTGGPDVSRKKNFGAPSSVFEGGDSSSISFMPGTPFFAQHGLCVPDSFAGRRVGNSSY